MAALFLVTVSCTVYKNRSHVTYKKLDAYRVYLAMAAISAFAFGMATTNIVVYFVQTIKMVPLQLVLMGTAQEAAAFIFEIPTGIVADYYSRRLSVIIGQFLIGASFLLMGALPSFVAILGAQFIMGLGNTFISGALDAWIADELGVDNLGRVFARANQAGTIGWLAGIVASSALALIWLPLSILVAGALFVVLGLALAMFMPEQKFKPARREQLEQRNGRALWHGLTSTFMQAVRLIRGSPLLIMLMMSSLVFGSFSEGLDRLWEVHLLNDIGFPVFQPVVWFGVIAIVAKLLDLLVMEFVRRRVDMSARANTGRALLVSEGLMAAGVVAFALAPGFLIAMISQWFVSVMRNVSGPVFGTWLNQNINSEVRATALSMSGQSNALGQTMGGPAIGAIGTLFSVRTALVVSALLLTPALALYARTAWRKVPAPAQVEVEPAISQ